MASSGLLDGPWADQHNYMRPTMSMLAEKLYSRRLRARPTRTLFLTIALFLFSIILLARSLRESPLNYWVEFPSYHPYNARPEDAEVVPPGMPPFSRNDTLPQSLEKTNPSFHVVLPATRKSHELCRSITSAMILNYPPPTVVGYGKSLPDGAKAYDAMVDRITGINNFLAHSRHVHDGDFVLIADGLDVFFQLPPEIMIQRFQDLLRENNAKLLKKYGVVVVENPNAREGEAAAEPKQETLQKYSQRVLFSASKECFPTLSMDAGCVSVPQSSLPPDSYGWDTDTEWHLTRPRWIKPGAVIGQVADLKLIYAEVLRFVDRHRHSKGDYLALTQMFGRQEYVRELERRRTSSLAREMIYDLLGISDSSNLTTADPHLESGKRYEYGIGVDYESRIFYNMLGSKNDVEWLQYHNATTTSAVQMQHGVPREHRLLLPTDLSSNMTNPFVQPIFGKDEAFNPPFNATLDYLPSPRNRSWNNLPLLTNIHSASVPAMVHLDGDRAVRDTWWERMWFHPWGRALLRKFMRTPGGFDAAQSALEGGQEWWDLRGGKGGIWTDKGEWIDYADICTGYERDLFNDGHGKWAKESGEDNEEPVYNQFGNLIKGKEK